MDKSKRKSKDIVAELGLGLCAIGVFFLFIAGDELRAKALIRLECTRGRDCFLTKEGWFSSEVTHFREPALKGATVVEARDGKRRTPLGIYRPVLEGEGLYSPPLWDGYTSNRQEAELDAARVVAWKAASDAAPLRMESDFRGVRTRQAGHIAGGALVPLALGAFLLYRRGRKTPRSTPASQPRRERRRDKQRR